MDTIRKAIPNAYKKWTDEERDEVIASFDSGTPDEEIADRHGRSRVSIRTVLHNAGRLDDWQLPEEPE